MGNITNIPAQVANQCCCEKKAVYNVEKGTWASPFQGAGEFASVSDLWSKSSKKPSSRGEVPSVVLVGGTGVGKSNLGNYLLGSRKFESRNSQESVTAVTTWIDGTWFGGRHPLRVVDCTGIGDTKGAGADQKQWDTTIQVLNRVGKINALVMVIRAGRFTKFDKEVITTLRESFGASFWKNMCVFCTGANAKPGQLDLSSEGPKIRRKMHQIEKEQGNDQMALEAIQNMQIYAADLDPTLASPESRSVEFKFKPSLSGLGLEELLSLDLRIPQNVMDMSSDEFRRFANSDTAIERWIEGNYFQLGLSRLAAFKTDLMAMEPFTIASLGRLPDAPETEKPSPEQADDPEDPSATVDGTGISESLAEDHLRYFMEFDSLELALLGQEVVLLKGSWLVEMQESGKALPRRQELPEEASWDANDLSQSFQGDTDTDQTAAPTILALSYSWLTPEHPDPDGFHLQQLGPMLKAYASWNRTKPESIAVFLDWCSLPQQPRTEDEAAAFDRAMAHVHLWYAHAMTSTWLLSRVPEGKTPFRDRGWPYFEKAVSMMANPAESILDLGLARHNWTSWGQVLQDCRVKPLPPPAPETFATELVRKAFAEPADRELLARRYGEAFRGAVGSAERLPYAGLRWSDREAVRISKLLPLCENLRELELQQNDIGRRGAMALANGVLECPELERLSVWGNCIEEEAREALIQAWSQAGKPEVGLEIGEQRKPSPQMEIITNAAASGTNPQDSPRSPLRAIGSTPGRSPTRRTADEQTALQMAELGARQAAFEARLHVAINRISATLGEVGDAVSTPMGGGAPSLPAGSSGSWATGSPTASGFPPARAPGSPTASGIPSRGAGGLFS